MIINPVYKREVIGGAKSVRFAVAIAVFNAFLAFVALVQMSAVAEGIKNSTDTPYNSFLLIFRLVGVLEFLIIYFIVPAFTSGSISSERENRSIDLILSTKITAFDLIAGKLFASVFTAAILIISSIPVFAMISMYGGISGRYIPVLFLSYFAATFFVGNIGMFFSSIFRKTVMATVVTYAVLIIFTVLTFLPLSFIKELIPGNINIINSYPLVIETQSLNHSISVAHDIMPWIYIINPINLFYITINFVIGNKTSLSSVFMMMGIMEGSVLHTYCFWIGIGFQLLAGLLLMFLSTWNVTPGINKRLFIKKIGRN